MTLTRDDYLDTLDREVAALGAAAETAGLSAPVPPCPDWTVADLVHHTGEVFCFWQWVLESGTTDASGYEEPARPADDALVEWLRAEAGALATALRARPDDTPTWSWAPAGGTVGWLVRRVAHEAAVHRWDGESAAGAPTPLPPELAADDVDEFLTNFTGFPVARHAPVGGTVHLHCTDVAGEWLVTEDDPDGPLSFTREHAKGDAAVRGAASDLALLLWRRVPLDDRFEVFGDRGVADRLVARSSLG